MSRGAMGPVVTIVLGALAILLVVALFIMPRFADTEKAFDWVKELTGVGKPNVVVPGTQVREKTLPTFRMEESYDVIKVKLVDLLLECWKQRDKQNYDCFTIELDVPSTGEDRLPLVELAFMMQERGQPDAAEALLEEDNWKHALAGEPVLHLGREGALVRTYKICVDHDRGLNDDDLFITPYQDLVCE